MTLSTFARAPGGLAVFLEAVVAVLRLPIDSTRRLLRLAGLPVFAAAWAILAPARVFTNAMTCDLMFNLAGAWHLWHGDRMHLDFHDPLGSLNFFLTVLGFGLVGLGPKAFLVGMAIVACALFVLAFQAALRRLPLLPAALFVTFVCLLVLTPANVGDRPDQYSLAMSYNRYGWAAYSVLGLVLLVPPRRDAWGGDTAEIVGSALLLLALFYLKITYFAVGLGTVAVALWLQPHVRRNGLRWLLAALMLASWAVLPHNWAYLADVVGAAGSGAIRSSLRLHVGNFLAAGSEYAPYLGLLVVGVGLYLTGRAPLRLPLSLAAVLLGCLALLSQNSQSAGMPALIVMVMILYDHLRSRFHEAPGRDLAPVLAALLALPSLAVAHAAFSIAGYHVQANGGGDLFEVRTAGLRGLAVPAGQPGAFASFPRNGYDMPLPNGDGVPVPRYDLSQQEYLATLQSAVALLADEPPGGIALLDQVNPLPFMLGWRPVPGASLWSLWSLPVQPADGYLGPVRYVLVPRFPTERNWTTSLVARYGDYIAAHFERRQEAAHWTLFVRRDDADASGSPGSGAYSAGGTNM